MSSAQDLHRSLGTTAVPLPRVHHFSPRPPVFLKANGIKGPPSVRTAAFSPSMEDRQYPEGEQSSPGRSRASRRCGADLPRLSQHPVASFSGETGSQLEILISANATVVSSRLLSRSIFPPTFLCASQTPPAAGSSPPGATRLVCFQAASHSC